MSSFMGCAALSEQRGDEPAGTLADFDIGVFVETRRPMPRLALADICPPFAQRIVDYWETWRATGQGLHPRALAIRNPRSPERPDAPFLVLAVIPTVDGLPLQFSWRLPTAEALMDFDLEQLVANPQAHVRHLDARRRVVVCTHGKVDPCCAVRGHAVYRRLAEASDVEVWQGSHFGGCRFAGNLWCLPSGNCYGHVAPAGALALVAADSRGFIAHRGWRGRLGQAPERAAAEALLRRRHEVWCAAALRVAGMQQTGPHCWTVQAEIDGQLSYWMLERIQSAERFRLLCRSDAPSPTTGWRLGPESR